MPIDVLENKVLFKCTFINAELKDEVNIHIPITTQNTVIHLIFCSEHFVKTHSNAQETTFSQNFHTMKLGVIVH